MNAEQRVEAAATVLASQWAGDQHQLAAALQVTRQDAQTLEDAGLLANPKQEAPA